MKRAVLVIVIGVLTGIAASSPVEAASAAQGVIHGVVRDDKGAPVGTAIVRAKNISTKVTKIALTDPKGNFYLPDLADAQYQISVQKKGFEAKGFERFDLHGTGQIDLKMHEMQTIDVAQLTTSDILRHLPDAPGKNEFGNICGGCHGLERAVEAGGRSREDWEDVLKRMSDQPGGYITINKTTTATILDYVTKVLPPGTDLVDKIAAAVKMDKPELPEGHELIYTEYEYPTENSVPHTLFPDAAGKFAWFSEFGPGIVGNVNLETGEVKEFNLSTPDLHPHGLTIGGDGTVWFAAVPYILGRVDPKTDKIQEIPIPKFPDGQDSDCHSLMVASDGKVWFTETHRPAPGAVSSYDPATGKFTRYALEPGDIPYGIIQHEDMIWFTILFPGKFASLNPKTGKINYYDIPSQDNNVRRLRFDKRGRAWFGEFQTSKIGMFDPATKRVTEYDLPFRGTPYSLHIDGSDKIWVAAFDRDSFIKFDPDTKKMIEYPLPKTGALIRDIWPDSQTQLNRWWANESGWNNGLTVEFLRKPGTIANF